MSHTYNLYINSKNRGISEKTYDFNIRLQNQITINKNQYINIDVCSFYMINSMYNISSIIGNNTFDIEVRNVTTNALISTIYKTIPDGNYNVSTLKNMLNSLLLNIIEISYNSAQNTYNFKKLDAGFKYILKNINCTKLIGLANTPIEITTIPITSTYLNMVDYQQIIIKTDLEYMNLNQDNITSDNDNNLNVSQILLFVNKQDVEPFKSIQYRNEDGGDTFSYNLINQNINKINFKVLNENGKIIKDCPDWLIHLKLTISDKHQSTYYELMNQMISKLSDIHYVLLNMLFQKKSLY